MKKESFFCDICGKEIKLPLHIRFIKSVFKLADHSIFYSWEPVHYVVYEHEICEACFKKIGIYIDNLKQNR